MHQTSGHVLTGADHFESGLVRVEDFLWPCENKEPLDVLVRQLLRPQYNQPSSLPFYLLVWFLSRVMFRLPAVSATVYKIRLEARTASCHLARAVRLVDWQLSESVV